VQALTAGTQRLIVELYRLANMRTWFSSGRSRADEIASLLQRIADTCEPLAIPRIISLALDGRREIAEAAGHAVKKLSDLVNARDLSMFDRAFRDLSPWANPESARWRELRPTDLRSIAALSSGPTLLQLAMCHPSGYVREEAIRRSATCADGSEVAFLLLRANDWVKPVRDLAHSALRARLRVEHVPDLVAALPIIDVMHRWSRLGPPNIVGEIEQFLRDPCAVRGLMGALSSPDRFIRRGAYRRLLERDHRQVPDEQSSADESHGPYRSSPPGSKTDLFLAAMRDRDPAIRAGAGRWLIAADEVEFGSLVEELLRNGVGAIRFGAAQRLLAAGSQLPWSDLLLDPHAGVRALAQQAALEAGRDPDAEYRARLASSQGSRLGIALVGLSETGGPADAALVRTYLQGDRPVVRKCGLHALVNFKVEDIVELALGALRDESPSVTRVAGDLLLARIASVRGADIWSTFTTTSSGPGRRAALAVISRLGFWESLPYLLRAFAAADGPLSPLVQLHVTKWIARQTRIFVPPPASLESELRELVGESQLPEHMRRELVGVLETRLRSTKR
jgi:HEAT repeat protein